MKSKLILAMLAFCAVVAVASHTSTKTAEFVTPDPWTIDITNEM